MSLVSLPPLPTPPASAPNLSREEYLEKCKTVINASFGRYIPMSSLEFYAQEILEHLENPEKQKSLYQNEDRNVLYIAANALGVKMSDESIDATLRFLVLAGRIDSFASGHLDNRSLGMANVGYWVYPGMGAEVKPYFGTLFTKEKLLEFYRNMEVFKKKLHTLLPQSPDESDNITRVRQSLISVWCQRLVYPYGNNEACPLDRAINPKHPDTVNVMDFLAESKVIAAWNVNWQLNNVHIKFDPSDEDSCVSYLYQFPSWRGAAS